MIQNKMASLSAIAFAALFTLSICSELSAQSSVPKTDSLKTTPRKTETKSEILVTFVELGSVNCVPCKMMEPVLKDVEEKYGTQVKVVFHDVWTDAGKKYGVTYGIKSIPTQVFLDKEGIEYYRHEGYFPKEELVKILAMKGVKL
jgi:thioredoxin 1